MLKRKVKAIEKILISLLLAANSFICVFALDDTSSTTEQPVQQETQQETSETQNEVQEAQQNQEYTYSDDSVSVTVTAPVNALPADAILHADKIDNSEVDVLSESDVLDDTIQNSVIYDVYFTFNDEEIEPTQPVQVSMNLKISDIDSNMDTSTVNVKHIKDNNEVNTVADTNDVGGITSDGESLNASFTTDSFSYFVICYGKNNNNEPNNPLYAHLYYDNGNVYSEIPNNNNGQLTLSDTLYDQTDFNNWNKKENIWVHMKTLVATYGRYTQGYTYQSSRVESVKGDVINWIYYQKNTGKWYYSDSLDRPNLPINEYKILEANTNIYCLFTKDHLANSAIQDNVATDGSLFLPRPEGIKAGSTVTYKWYRNTTDIETDTEKFVYVPRTKVTGSSYSIVSDDSGTRLYPALDMGVTEAYKTQEDVRYWYKVEVLFKKNVEFLAKNLEQSVNLYRMDANENIELVVGDATNMFPNGSLSGQASGFGQHENAYFWQSTEYKGNAYFGMFDSSSLLEPIGQLTNGDLLNKTPEEWEEQLNYIKVLVELLLKKNSNPTPEPISLEENEEETVEEDVLTEARRNAAIRYSEASVYSDRDLDDMIALTNEQTADLEAFINEHPEDLNTVEGDTASGLVDTMFNLTSLGDQLDETGNEQFINGYEQILDFVKELIKNLPEDQQKKILDLVETLLQVTERDNLLAFKTILQTLSTSIRGFDMYATGNGVDFTAVTQNGFGDPYNHGLRVFAQSDDWMAIGTANPFYGTQLWKLKEEPTEPTDPSEPVKNIFTITFNDQKGNVTTVKAEEGSEVAFPSDPTCDGFKFEGWFTEAKNGTKITSLIAEKDMTVYAQWTDLKKAESKNNKSADTSDQSNPVIYIVGVIAAVAVAGFVFKNRIHNTK